jgi:hypothetical protein
MYGPLKTALIVLGALAALLIVSQLVLGQIILSAPLDVARWVKRHQHTGYLTVVVSLVYILGSLLAIASVPTRPKS